MSHPSNRQSVQNTQRRNGTQCTVCGSRAISSDEVQFTGATEADSLLLAECLRCEHRWTQPIFRSDLTSRRARLEPVRRNKAAEVASAA